MEDIHSLQPMILLLAVGIVAMVVSRPLRQSPIVGYLIGGVLVGPSALGLIEPDHTTHLLAELGVVFLLFDIGLHFSLGHIWETRRYIFGLGPLQIGLCTLAFAAMGWAAGLSLEMALLLGAAFSLSSTAVAVQTLVENGRQRCPIGVSATAVLVFQDLCAIFLLILLTSLESGDSAIGLSIAMAAVKAILAFVAAIAFGRLLISPLFRLIAGSQQEEAFTASALLLVLATAVATGLLGLSMTLGAFLAGMIISETPYRHLLRTEMKPFRGLLLGFFFITVGMSIDPRALAALWLEILAVLAVLVAVKVSLILIAGRLVKMPLPVALQLGATLFQGSEFAFVILAAPTVRLALGSDWVNVIVAAIAASMALTPALVALANRIGESMAENDWVCRAGQQPGEDTIKVILFGMTETGRRVADGLSAFDIEFKAFETDQARFLRAETDGYPVAYGDVTDLRLAETIEMAHTDAVVLTVARYEISAELNPVVKERYPDLRRFVSVDSQADRERFEALGMRAIVDRSIPKGLDLASTVLADMGVDAVDVSAWMSRQQDLELKARENRPLPLLVV